MAKSSSKPKLTPVLGEEEEAPKRVRHKNRCREYMDLEIPLTRADIQKKEQRALAICMEIEDLNDQLRKMSRDFTRTRREKRQELKALRTQIKERKETRHVLAECHIDHDKAEVRCFFEGKCLKVISARELKEVKGARIDERQQKLFGGGSPTQG